MVEQMGLGGDTVSGNVGEEHRAARIRVHLGWSRASSRGRAVRSYTEALSPREALRARWRRPTEAGAFS